MSTEKIAFKHCHQIFLMMIKLREASTEDNMAKQQIHI